MFKHTPNVSAVMLCFWTNLTSDKHNDSDPKFFPLLHVLLSWIHNEPCLRVMSPTATLNSTTPTQPSTLPHLPIPPLYHTSPSLHSTTPPQPSTLPHLPIPPPYHTYPALHPTTPPQPFHTLLCLSLSLSLVLFTYIC